MEHYIVCPQDIIYCFWVSKSMLRSSRLVIRYCKFAVITISSWSSLRLDYYMLNFLGRYQFNSICHMMWLLFITISSLLNCRVLMVMHFAISLTLPAHWPSTALLFLFTTACVPQQHRLPSPCYVAGITLCFLIYAQLCQPAYLLLFLFLATGRKKACYRRSFLYYIILQRAAVASLLYIFFIYIMLSHT